MFEALTLGVFEAGLSWSIVFGKRDAFRAAFHDFDVARVAAMRSGTSNGCCRTLDHPQPRQDRGHRRERARDESASPSLAALARFYATPQACAAVPRRPPQLDTAGGRVRQAVEVPGLPIRGPTSVYAFMQNIGVVNDHLDGCFRAAD